MPNIRIRTALADAARRLGSRFEAEWLLAHAMNQPHAWLFAHADDMLDAVSTQAFEALLARRESGEPVAYITGVQGFWSLDLAVTSATLIPRADTETLVEQALLRLPVGCDAAVADLGTGSGAVALAIAHDRPRVDMLATDASAAALAVARGNSGRLGLQRVRFAHGDWYAALGSERFDVIVSNPPYVEAGDAHLQQGDLRFEPLSALVSGADGLDAIRAIIDSAPAHLVEGGWLLLEHGWNQAEAVRGLLSAAGFADVFTALDLGERDRVSGGRR